MKEMSKGRAGVGFLACQIDGSSNVSPGVAVDRTRPICRASMLFMLRYPAPPSCSIAASYMLSSPSVPCDGKYIASITAAIPMMRTIIWNHSCQHKTRLEKSSDYFTLTGGACCTCRRMGTEACNHKRGQNGSRMPTIKAFCEWQGVMPCPSQKMDERGKKNATILTSQFVTVLIIKLASDMLTTSLACCYQRNHHRRRQIQSIFHQNDGHGI